ncbi:MAG: hypothetical protein ACYTFW_00840 [Planctomycetota bacterium]|jgi:hypothetical protein
MDSFIIYPILGLKSSVPYTDPSLLRPVGSNAAEAHCVDCQFIDFSRNRNACSKSKGRAQWSSSAVSTPTYCSGIFEVYDGSNRTLWIAYDGDMYRYDASRDPQEVEDAGSTAFASDVGDIYSFIRYGNYMVFADRAEHTPYCSDHNDANLLKLISSGTEYKFRYLETFARRIIGAYSDQTNGELEIRWSNSNPAPNTSCTFAATNQLFVPNDDPITGIKKMGRNACYVYCEDSINRLDYYANYSYPFGLTTIVDGQGATGHHGIVNENGVNYFHNKNYGFCAYSGGNQVVSISRDIENLVRDIRSTYAAQIVGASAPSNNTITWTVPTEGSATPNLMFTYDYHENKWAVRDLTGYYVTPMVNATDVTWTKLTTEMGYTDWTSLGDLRWADLVNEKSEICTSASNGHLYTLTTESNNGEDYNGYRVEPALSLGGLNNHSILFEIWFSIVFGGDFSIYVDYRGGDTEQELRLASWTRLDEVSCNSPDNCVCRLDNLTAKASRLHQIGWGTASKNEQFVVNKIEFVYETQGRY